MNKALRIPSPGIDKQKVRQQFGRASITYDEASGVQRRMADKLLTLHGNLDGKDVVDLGCGTGYMLGKLEQRGPASLLAVDISTRMLTATCARVPASTPVAADIDSLPFADNSFDCIFSNAALQWCELETAATEIRRVLREGGRLYLTTFGPSTLCEWKTGGPGGGLSTTRLHTASSIKTVFDRLGFRKIRVSRDHVRLEYRSVDAMFSAIRDLGATFAGTDRQRGLMGKNRYMDIRSYFEARLQQEGKLSLTFEPLSLSAAG